MKQEKSCGAVIYRFHHKALQVLVQHMQQGHFSLPKGHVEPGETERQTARREILEETGIEVILHRDFRHVVSYSPQPQVMKDVVFFIARYHRGQTTPQLSEVQALEWLDLDSAIERVTYPTDKEVLRHATRYLSEKYPNSL